VAAEQRSNELTIMETIASVSKALQEYERRRLRLSRCNRHRGRGPRGARGSRGADKGCVCTTTCQ
jgi:hypothetical protein